MAFIKLIEKDEVDDSIRSLYEMMESSYGFTPNILKTIAHCPDLLNSFVPFWVSAYVSPTIGQRFRSLAALGTANAHHCAYCISHMSSTAKKAGLSNEEIQATTFDSNSNILDERESLIVEYANVLTKDSNGVTAALRNRLKKNFTDAEIVNITLIIGLYNFTGRFLKALEIDIEDVFSK